MGDPYAALGQVVTPPAASQPPAQGADPYARLGEQQSAAPASPDANSNKMRDHVQQLIDTGANQDEIETYVRSVGIDPGRITGLKEALVARGMGAHPEVKLQDLVAGKPPAQVGVRDAGTEDTGFLHHAAIVGKGIVQGLSDFNDMMPWSGAAFAHNLGAPSHSEIFDAQLEHAGVAQAQTRGQRIEESAARGVGSALPLGPAAPGAAALNAFAGASAGGAGQLAKEEGYGPGVQFAASLAAGGAPYALKGGINAFASRAATARAASNALVDAPAVANAAAQEGVPISRPFVDASVRNKLTHLETTKGGAPVVAQGLNNTATALEGRVNALADQGTALNTDIAGGKIQAAGRGYIDTTRGQKNALYSRAEKLAGDTRVLPTKAVQAIRDNINQLTEQGATTNAAQIRYLQDLARDLGQDGGISIQGLRGLRSGIRGQISERNLQLTDAERRVSGVLDAASQDLQGALSKTAPKAAAAYRTADKFYAERQQTIRDVVQQFIGRADTPLSAEKAFAKFQAMASPGGDAARLARMRALMPPADQADLAATFAHTLGRDAADSFSPALFVSQAAKLSEAARTHLFGAEGEASIKRLLTIATQYRDVARNLNNSRTGVAMNYRAKLPAILGMMSGGASLFEHGMSSAAVTGAGVSIATTAANTVVDRLSAKALMNPDVSRWIASAPATTNPTAIRTHIARLTGIIANNPALGSELGSLKTRLLQGANDNMPRAAAASDQQQQNKQ